MQLACPACAATYQVPDALIGQGRQMRCVRCGEAWFATAPAAEEATPPAVQPASSPIRVEDRPALPSAEPVVIAPAAPSRALMFAWLASAAVWLGGLYALWAWQGALAQAWPPLARLLGAG